MANVAQADANLKAAIEQAPGLFVKPRTIVLHGLKLGYQKGKGKIDPYRGVPAKADSRIAAYLKGGLAVKDKPVCESRMLWRT